MSMRRKIAREIARNRLKDAGFEKVNRRLDATAEGKKKRSLKQRKKIGPDAWKKDPPVWRRVLTGDLEEKAVEAWKKASMHRAIRSQSRRIAKKRKLVKVSEAAS